MSERPGWFPCAVIALWIAVQASALLRAALPLPRPWSAKLPWQMFSSPAKVDITISAQAMTPAGEWIKVPLRRYFHYTRGLTDRRVYDSATALVQPGHAAEREAFARWLAARLAADGTPVREIRLIQRRVRVDDGRVRRREIGRYRVDDVR